MSIPLTSTEINGFTYGNTSPEDTDYILFVHGWRMLTWERRYFAETAYKRLFWANYRGRYGFFSWPTEHCDPAYSEPGNYDRSERKAWHSGAGLLSTLRRLEGLYPNKVRVMAHSMGNIVVSEALRLEVHSPNPSIIVHTYVASQGASVAHAYDSVGPQSAESGVTTQTPEVYAAYPPSGTPYFRGIASAVAVLVINFCNTQDDALNLGWKINQDMKPDADYDFEYVGLAPAPRKWTYNPDGPLFFILDFPMDTYQIYSHVAEARSLALGAELNTAGEIGSVVDLNAVPHSYGDRRWEHSAQFRSTASRRLPYWIELLENFKITIP
jgi:Alpha/beta hydrolase of unknown function (DUF900)